MPEVSASIDVPASPAVVWDILLDVESYPQWNTLLRVDGPLTVDETVDASVSVPGLPTISFRPRIVALEPQRELRWRTSFFGFDTEHSFSLEPSSVDGTTRFVQHETIRGPFADRVVGGFERRLRRGFEQMNVGLKRRALDLAMEREAEQTD